MKKPEDPENFIQFSVDDLAVYIEKNAWEDVKVDNEIVFKVHNYGEFVLEFSVEGYYPQHSIIYYGKGWK